jgi:16S rRNA (uracil1498-N3)-methyltransferase
LHPRFYCPLPLQEGALIDLPSGVVRHVQVLRLQPGSMITLFAGDNDAEFEAVIRVMGRSHVQVQIAACKPTQREATIPVHLVVAVPANDRMDWLVEKATEWGVNAIYPTMTERSVVRLSAERAEKKVAHWQSIAVAACEQCGGNRVPRIEPVLGYVQRLQQFNANLAQPIVLSLQPQSIPMSQWMQRRNSAGAHLAGVTVLSGPEGGLSPHEEQMALEQGYIPVSLGRRVLRAETAAVSALAILLHSPFLSSME